MGWSFRCDPSFGRKEQIEEVKRPGHFSPGYEALEHRVVGNNVWTLLEFEGERFIALTMMKGGGRNSGWGYKGVNEMMGPVEVNCPLSLLDKCTETDDEYALSWRRRVRQYHAARKARPQPETGCLVALGDHQLRLHSEAGSRRGWYAHSLKDNVLYRLTTRQLAQARYVVSEGSTS